MLILEETSQGEILSPEVLEVMRNLVSAIRAVKLYPPNNPIYVQATKKSHESLNILLELMRECRVGVQKTHFTFGGTPVGKETQLNRALAQDLFTKGVRELVFLNGLTGEELLELLQALALTAEEMAMKSGISSILWEKGAAHIKVTEAGLDEIITAQAPPEKRPLVRGGETAQEEQSVSGRSLLLGDLTTDPAGFGARMLDLAGQSRLATETIEDRLLSLYQETGRKIDRENPEQREVLFTALAQSALALETPHRERFIGGRLYGDLDAETANEQKAELEEHLPSEFHEILTGRFSQAWTAPQVATLLKKSSAKTTAPSPPPRRTLEIVPVPEDLSALVADLAEYTPDELEALKNLNQAGMESDILEAALRTLIFLLPLVKNPLRPAPDEKEINLFSGVVRQLEDLLSYLLRKKDYALASLGVRALRVSVHPAFEPRLAEAVKKTASKSSITASITDLRTFARESPEYHSAYAYLTTLEREATEVLLELLAEETSRPAREFFLEMLKDLGKNQIMLMGERLTDERWYFVRNIVSILAETKTDHALQFLQKVADHKNMRIRQEVVKGLSSIGGKKAAGLLTKFLKDQETEVQLMAVRGLAEMEGAGREEAKALTAFLEERKLNAKEQEATVEAIKALAKIGGPEASEFLKRYIRVRWWRSRKLQAPRRVAALRAIEEIGKREGHGGRALG